MRREVSVRKTSSKGRKHDVEQVAVGKVYRIRIVRLPMRKRKTRQEKQENENEKAKKIKGGTEVPLPNQRSPKIRAR